MKKINESRINGTINYIEEYYNEHNTCPTYRQILEDLNYSSLSLVHADIKRLKERGLLVEGEFEQIQLPKQKEERLYRYDYPFLSMTDAYENINRLNEEEKKLLTAQDYYLKGEYSKSIELSLELIDSTSNESVEFGARFNLACCALYTGKVEYWKDLFRRMISYQSKSLSENKEKEMMVFYLTSSLGNSNNVPTWIKEGRFYSLRKEAYPLANLLFVSYCLKENPSLSPKYLEPLCSLAFTNKSDLCQVCMDLYLAISYHYVDNKNEYLDSHLRNAIKTCIRHNWLTPLSQMKKTLGMVMDPIIERYDPSLVDKVSNLNVQMKKGYDFIYQSLVGDNPVKDLTFREIEIINFVRLGFSTKEIANKLYLAPDTVKYYLSSIYLKLGISGRTELKKQFKNYL